MTIHRTLRRVFITVVACMVLGAEPATAQDTATAIQVPSVGGASDPVLWLQVSNHSYEEETPGYGTSKGYRSDLGNITIYSYTRGVSDWSNGVSDARLAVQVDEVVAGIREAERRGIYANVSVESTKVVTIASHDFFFVESSLQVRDRHAWSAALLTVRGGKLLKYRMTTGAQPVSNPKQALFQFVEASLPSL